MKNELTLKDLKKGKLTLSKVLIRSQLLKVINDIYSDNAQSDEVHNRVIATTHKIIYRLEIPQDFEEFNKLVVAPLEVVLRYIEKHNISEQHLLYIIANRMMYLTVTGIKEYGDIFPQKTINFIMPLAMSLDERLETTTQENKVDVLTDIIGKYGIDINS